MTEVLSIHASGALSTVDFDDGTSLRCTRDFAARSHFSRGQEIDPVFVDRLRESASFDLATHEARRLIRRQRYSRNEIAAKLNVAGLASDVIRETLGLLERRGELDDLAVALHIARQKLRLAQSRNAALTWSEFGPAQARRLTMRGFHAGAAKQAVRLAWSELA
ncbi:MAG: RecX family transcriptional regulator [Chloroflexota bacterium]|nr:RecX family transcriptional regulator [Chloroflexota bacterium]MDE2892916.1 RecX family transcriptional regulator [Chloroflexota bacterium]